MSDFGELDPIEPAEPATPPATPSPEEKWKQENAQLREQNRTLNAGMLAAKHNLPDEVADLLALVPKDQQQAKAEVLAAKFAVQPATPPAEPPSEEPAENQQLQDLADPPAGGGEPFVDPMSDEEIQRRLMAAETPQEMWAIQAEIQDAHRKRMMGEAPS